MERQLRVVIFISILVEARMFRDDSFEIFQQTAWRKMSKKKKKINEKKRKNDCPILARMRFVNERETGEARLSALDNASNQHR